MAKTVFSVTYSIIPEKRDEYFSLMKKVKEEVEKTTGQKYSVLEDTQRPNLMSEVYYIDKAVKLENIKDLQNEMIGELLSEIENFLSVPDEVALRNFMEVI